MTLYASPDEHARGALDPGKLADIRAAIETHGYVVVAGLIDADVCGPLEASVQEDATRVVANGAPTRHERRTGRGHLQLGLRRHAPYVRSEVVANPLVESVVAAILGDGAWLGFYNGNVNCPGSGTQPVHFDRPFSWKTRAEAFQDGQPWPPPTTTLSCSVALADIDEHNGATEIYPGTHRETAVTAFAPGERVSDHPELLERWDRPAFMTIPAGGICFRDPRMWHRGVSNRSDTVRPMIALTYHARSARHWRGLLIRDMDAAAVERCEADAALRVLDSGRLGEGRLVFHESARPAFALPSRHGVNRNVRFVADPLVVNHFLDAHEPGGARVVEAGTLSVRP